MLFSLVTGGYFPMALLGQILCKAEDLFEELLLHMTIACFLMIDLLLSSNVACIPA
jgi:hypothetical protein